MGHIFHKINTLIPNTMCPTTSCSAAQPMTNSGFARERKPEGADRPGAAIRRDGKTGGKMGSLGISRLLGAEKLQSAAVADKIALVVRLSMTL